MSLECQQMYSLSKIRGPHDDGCECETSAGCDPVCCGRVSTVISD